MFTVLSPMLVRVLFYLIRIVVVLTTEVAILDIIENDEADVASIVVAETSKTMMYCNNRFPYHSLDIQKHQK
jgi:uncharacterized membrane protein